MSASEKLKALGETRRWPVGYARSKADESITAALPQIVAVVEAAEGLVEYLEEVDPYPTSDGHPLYAARAALTALEEALS